MSFFIDDESGARCIALVQRYADLCEDMASGSVLSDRDLEAVEDIAETVGVSPIRTVRYFQREQAEKNQADYDKSAELANWEQDIMDKEGQPRSVHQRPSPVPRQEGDPQV